MLQYETLILAPTEVTADELTMIENHFENLMSQAKGKLSSFDKWGKYRLAYPIKNNDYGIYVLIRYELPQEETSSIFKQLQDFFKIKCNEIVIRYVTTKLEPGTPLTYKHPDPIDAGRSGNLDEFLKESKIESFLSSVDSSKNETRKQETTTEEKKEDVQKTNNETQES